MTRTAI